MKSGKIVKPRKLSDEKANARKLNRQQLERANDTAKKNQKSQLASPTIPFDPNDHILLVGEGDFSFAHSIVSEHGCADVLATCFDSEDQLLQKYPQAKIHIDYLTSLDQSVLYSVDATKLQQKVIRKGQQWDRIIFNFPHVGGKSTDVNRQVRYNQELLVSFFRAAYPQLSPGGTIIVTLFEGEPYTLWNIKDLARHVGLKVVTSFKFISKAYPEYEHARTLGNIEGGGGWKGEERDARTYIFQLNESEEKQNNAAKKRKADDSSSDDED
ncbi:hypothetical protein AOQ84DRAFT_299719 [Glonium stellatum]|uniref:25S rRNA (uridine-N(3))-methyltransferase BMT5-like domain-containing protein n=1 Tax=Glonium stellatum TaxID=574774 RepID=A0A8E2EVE5_9PEZI|nr:hypothetical protein AOQ84DRAFT_299719 [Glonium stellatum]